MHIFINVLSMACSCDSSRIFLWMSSVGNCPRIRRSTASPGCLRIKDLMENRGLWTTRRSPRPCTERATSSCVEPRELKSACVALHSLSILWILAVIIVISELLSYSKQKCFISKLRILGIALWSVSFTVGSKSPRPFNYHYY